MSGSRWITKPSWLSGSLRSFLYSSFVYSCHFFSISSASVRSIWFLSFIVPIFAWDVPFISAFFLKKSLVFPIIVFSSLFLHWSLRKPTFLFLLFFGTLNSDGYIFAFLPCLSLLFSQIFVRPPQTAILNFCIFFPPLGMVLITASHTLFWTSIHSFSDTLSDLIPWIYFSLPLHNHKGFDLAHTWMA